VSICPYKGLVLKIVLHFSKMTLICQQSLVVNIQNVEGQLHGGIAMGLGYALTEEFIYTKTDSFAKFRVPRAKDMPDGGNLARYPQGERVL
jgi:hypothetical protein